jgi:TatD DNase family protein
MSLCILNSKPPCLLVRTLIRQKCLFPLFGTFVATTLDIMLAQAPTCTVHYREVSSSFSEANPRGIPAVLLTDSHAHVNARHFSRDRDAVLQRARERQVGRIICPGTDIPTSESAVALAHEQPGVIYAGAGVHPHDTAGFSDETLVQVRQLAADPSVVAIGEIGLDFFRNLSPADDQRHAFAAQVALARELDLPIIVHNRDAHADIMAELKQYGTVRGVWHCFIGDRVMAEEGLALGMYLSFAGPVTYPANTTLREVAAWAPLDRILVETDCPYLTPHPNRRDRNEPANVALVAAKVAELRGMLIEDLAATTSANAAALFRLPPPADASEAPPTGAE